MSTPNSERLKRIRQRWTSDHKLSTSDVEFLITRAEAADTLHAANELRGGKSSGMGDVFDALFGKGGMS